MLILMYPSRKRLFLTTGIYYLMQLLRSRRIKKIVLLVEFDFSTLNINHNILMEYLTSGKLKIVSGTVGKWGHGYDYHKQCMKTLKLVPKYPYDILFMPDDIYVMSNYLLQNIQFENAVCYQTAGSIASLKAHKKYLLQKLLLDARSKNTLKAYIKALTWLLSRYLNHLKNYFIFPFLLTGHFFFRSRSHYLMNGDVGKQADMYLVFSGYDRKCCLEDKVAPKKININGHPLQQSPALYTELKKKQPAPSRPEYDIAYFQTDILLDIPEYYDNLLLSLLKKNYEIAFKVHPTSISNQKLLDYLNKRRDRYNNLHIWLQGDFYDLAAKSKIILGETTSVLENVSFLFQDKPIVSINANRMFLGERYKNHASIIYTEDLEPLYHLLETNPSKNILKTDRTANAYTSIDRILAEFG